MNDDWRLHVRFTDHGLAHELSELLGAGEIEHDLERRFADRVVVSVDGPELFCYAGSHAQAQAAGQVVDRIATARSWQLESQVTHWHAEAERWEAPERPLPSTPAEHAQERSERMAEEREESAEQGYPEMEVQVACGSRHDAAQLSRTLEDEGITNLHRSRYVLIGATDEDSAQALAARVRAEAPGREVTVQVNARAAYANLPPNPFAVFGGLAG
ncbi:MAG: hypothetical protein JOZ07_01975 [Solirubrobacterales bacterium]|nr:hypothetical protein [Solirubrobacterales bacterium]